VKKRARLLDRPTPDLVVISLTAVVAFVIVATIVAVLTAKVVHPDADVTALTTRIAGLTNTLIGAIVGYLAGRGVVPDGAADEDDT
jgi:hypothetical protein